MPQNEMLLVFSIKSIKSLAIVAPAGGPCQSGNSCDGGFRAKGLRGQVAAPGLRGKCHWRITATSSAYVVCKRYDYKADVQYCMAQLSVPCSELSRRTGLYCHFPEAFRKCACGLVCGTWCFAIGLICTACRYACKYCCAKCSCIFITCDTLSHVRRRREFISALQMAFLLSCDNGRCQGRALHAGFTRPVLDIHVDCESAARYLRQQHQLRRGHAQGKCCFKVLKQTLTDAMI